MERIIYRSANKIVRLIEHDDTLTIYDVFYPLPGFGNRVERRVELDKVRKTISVISCSFDWNGTGCRTVHYVKLSENEFKEILLMMKNVKTINDLDKLKEVVTNIEKKRDKEVERLIDEIIRSIINTVNVNEQIKHDLTNYLKELAHEYLYS